eukprot:gnl/MRDRNA2_/MRDRNA2_93096_c0_seq1.p1 gnl/MRDRNA2_/MRDRNA2_93096_c0~~gnl/MRDRNA2_/MRDRNA2_93096_c0_seq1.p1  ORF type:complete len:268 (+),score=50.54 gnl/MRDRNA2_/MRDRNA2_93096_c0_seq1:77-805(+)
MGIDESAVKDLVNNLNSEFETFVEDASIKLKLQDAQSKIAREELKERCDLVRIFLSDFAPKAHDKVFANSEELHAGNVKGEKDPQVREMFTNQALPALLDHVKEDAKYLKEWTEEMQGFIIKYFKGNPLSEETDAVMLFRGVLNLLKEIKGGGGKPGGGGKDDRDGGRRKKDSRSPDPRDRRDRDRGGDRGRGGGRKDSRTPPRRGGRSRSRGGGGGGRSRSRGGGGRGRDDRDRPPRRSSR